MYLIHPIFYKELEFRHLYYIHLVCIISIALLSTIKTFSKQIFHFIELHCKYTFLTYEQSYISFNIKAKIAKHN